MLAAYEADLFCQFLRRYHFIQTNRLVRLLLTVHILGFKTVAQ